MTKPKTRRKRPNLILTPPPTEATPTSFSFALTRTAVSQICRSSGFRGAQLPALETLTRVAGLYIQSLAASAASSACSANRSQSNLVDLINALHDLNSIPGFSGASSLHCDDASPLRSSVLADLKRFVKYKDEIPFAKAVPRVAPPPPPVAKISPTSGSVLWNRRGPHVPQWLPDYPNARKERSCEKFERDSRRDKLWEETVADTEGKRGEPQRPEDGRGGKLPAKRRSIRFKFKSRVSNKDDKKSIRFEDSLVGAIL